MVFDVLVLHRYALANRNGLLLAFTGLMDRSSLSSAALSGRTVLCLLCTGGWSLCHPPIWAWLSDGELFSNHSLISKKVGAVLSKQLDPFWVGELAMF